MRIWDIEPKYLCRAHLLGEHRELHALWVILTQDKKAYRHHPETKRWEGKLAALYKRHEVLVKEMIKRNYQHLSPLDKKLARGRSRQTALVNSLAKQRELLRKKPCGCFIIT